MEVECVGEVSEKYATSIIRVEVSQVSKCGGYVVSRSQRSTRREEDLVPQRVGKGSRFRVLV